jgi:hypothetical protein
VVSGLVAALAVALGRHRDPLCTGTEPCRYCIDLAERMAPEIAKWLEVARPPAWTVPGDFLGGVGGWVEVIRLDQLRDAIRATDPTHPTPAESEES